eukprot:5621636-Alexandrium_andersonii.AAC.1
MAGRTRNNTKEAGEERGPEQRGQGQRTDHGLRSQWPGQPHLSSMRNSIVEPLRRLKPGIW